MHFTKAMKEIRTTPGVPTSPPEPVTGMNAADLRYLGARSLTEIERLAPATERATNKMPGNFIFAGPIHLALLNAPIVHTVRNLIDTCLSYFSKLFVVKQNHTYDFSRAPAHGKRPRSFECIEGARHSDGSAPNLKIERG
jgi:hypothetical protein